jgi:Holliday junction DNA helicase RuvA
MIAYLDGKLAEKGPTHAIVLAGGVGYKLFVPLSTYYELPSEGETVSLRVHTHVREDALSLYGFYTRREEMLFEKLISVAGVGPSLALKVMSGLEPDALIDSIRTGDRRRLNAIPGVGKKTAERLILELREKMPAPVSEDGSAPPAPIVTPAQRLADDVLSALENLGFPRAAAERAVTFVLDSRERSDGELEFEQALKAVLRKLSE